jgi:outer membrane protein assembly factor BamB
MRSFEIVVAPDPELFDPRDAAPAEGAARSGPRRRPAAREVLDVFIEGANVTARVAERHAACVLRDLAAALTDLASRPRGKAIVRFYDDAWELCVERVGRSASLSVYRTGSDPHVAVLDREVAWGEVVSAAREAMTAVLLRGTAAREVEFEMRALQETLLLVEQDLAFPAASGGSDRAPHLPEDDEPAREEPSPASVELDPDAPIAFGAEFLLRGGASRACEPSVERADLHALLFRGRVRADVRGRAIDLGEAHPFLVAERLLDLARQALATWERGQALHVRGEAGGILVGLRLAADGQIALSLGGARSAADPTTRSLHTFPALAVVDVVDAALSYGRALVRAILRRDRSQAGNLRLSAFRRALRETGDALREACQKDAKINPTPEPYRAFAIARAGARPSEAPIPAGTKLRYASRWRALVPGIDLRATFLCGDRLVIGAAAETFCLDRATGEVLWRAPTTRANVVVTPGGIARVHADGLLAVHDFGNGEVTLRTWLAPRIGGPPAGAVVHVQGLPRLLIVTEGERHLVAIDLTSGEPRWRHAWSKSAPRGAPRMKRAGKLLYFASGDSALTALDVLTGAAVWRVRDRLRFRTAPTLDHDALFAVAGGASSAAQLHAVDAFSGEPRWSRVLKPLATGGGAACTVEGAPLVASLGGSGGADRGPHGKGVVALPVRDRDGVTVVAYDRDTGTLAWESAPRIAPPGTSWIAVDDLFIGNTPTGEVVAIEAGTGALRYRHVLGRGLEIDVPRRLEPVLRSGALFVPHTDVRVLRPSDGALIGAIAPCDAIPDLLRVDERCDVYVAEESGHLAAFGAGPRLALVR